MPKSRAKSGRSLELLIAAIERALPTSPGTTIESPKFLADRHTGEPREHDVVVTVRSAHHTLQIAIECRDRSRKITVNDIEGFWAKCQDTGVDQAIVVSPRGFSKTALLKAKKLGMRCLLLKDVAGLDWLLTTHMTTRVRRIRHTSWTFFADGDFAPPPLSFTVLAADGAPVAPQVMTAAALKAFNSVPEEQLDDSALFKNILFERPSLTLRNDDTGEVRSMLRAVVRVEYSVEDNSVPFRLVSYSSGDDGRLITDAAVADVDFGRLKGKLMIVYNSEEGGQIVLVPDRV